MGAAAQRRAARGDRGPLAQAYAAKSDGLATDNQAAGMGAAETGAAGIGHYSSTAKEMKSHVPGTWVRSAPELLATIPGRLCLVECRLPVLLQQPISPGPKDVVHCFLRTSRQLCLRAHAACMTCLVWVTSSLGRLAGARGQEGCAKHAPGCGWPHARRSGQHHRPRKRDVSTASHAPASTASLPHRTRALPC